MVLVTQRKKRSDGHLLGEEQEDERREGMHRGCESESRGGKRRAEEEGEQESKPLVPKQLEQPKKIEQAWQPTMTLLMESYEPL